MSEATRGGQERSSALWGTGSRGGDGRSRSLRRSAVVGFLALVALALALPAGAGRDVTPPDTSIVFGPAEGSGSDATTVTFSFASTERNSAFECRVDGEAFAPCSGGRNAYHVARGLAVGEHAFEVRATDRAGNTDPTPAARRWTTSYATPANYAPGSLLARAKADPYGEFRVIVEIRDRDRLDELAANARKSGKLKHVFRSIDGINAKLPGWVLTYLADHPELYDLFAITEDAAVAKTGTFTPVQVWPATVGADRLWPSTSFAAPKPPTIAVVDSGIDATRADVFGARIRAAVAIGQPSPDDENGHGTLVASLAAGAATDYPGVAPSADLVSIRVMDANGMALTSDVIAAADWILANKDTYEIRVANFSLHSANANSFKFDPLDHAVERLWFNGIVVVAASGNYGTGARQGMYYAPGNDPFVITVGAADTMETVEAADDGVAPWSAFGYTADGFAKPEVVAPGRFIVGAVPAGSTLATTRPEKLVGSEWIRLSGTSFAAPVVAGAAAQLLALHPSWTPDDVKGALMRTSRPLDVADELADGIGEIDLAAAAAVTTPPRANAGLRRFLVADPYAPGGLAFDAASWTTTARSDASWDTASWSDASWSDASWSDASFASASWADASWSDAALADASWSDASWSD